MTSAFVGNGRTGDRLRILSAPAVAFAASALAAWCTVSLTAVVRDLEAFASLSSRFVGWLGLGLCLTVVSAFVAVLTSRKVGSGAALALGAITGGAGLLLGRDIADATQLAVAIVVLGLAAGMLFGGAASVAFEVPEPAAKAAVVAWAAPLVAGGAVQAWAVSHRQGEGIVLDGGADARWVVPVALAVAAWGVWSLLLEVVPTAGSSEGWHEAWWCVTMTQLVLFLVVMMIGFDARLRLYWLRPVVIVACSLALAVWLLVSMLLPAASAKIGFLSVSFVSAAVPPLIQVLFAVASRDSSGLGAGSLVGCLVAAALGGAVGWWTPRRAVIGGLIAVAVGAAGVWVVSGESWGWTLVIALLVGAGVCVATGGLLIAMDSVAASRFAAFAAVSALIVGSGIAIPLGWALLGDLPVGLGDARATTRVLAGLVFSLAALLAAYISILGRRIDRRLRRHHGISAPSAAAAFRGVGAVGDLPSRSSTTHD